MRIAVAQVSCDVGGVDANCARIRRWAVAAREADCQLAIFPEMVDTGYVMETIKSAATSWEVGAFPYLRDLAAELQLNIVCGLSERSDAGIHNAVAVIDTTGALISKYRKVHLFTGAPVHEERHLLPGQEFGVAELGGFRAGIMVCYDIRFPEMARAMALHGADMIIVPSAFPFPRLRHWNTLLGARAIENQVYVAAANRVGTDGPVTFCGSSQILDPGGVVLAAAPEVGETLITAIIDRNVLRATRSSLRVFDDRAPAVYRSAGKFHDTP